MKKKKTILFLISFFAIFGGVFALDYFKVINIPLLKLSAVSGPTTIYSGDTETFTYSDWQEIPEDCEYGMSSCCEVTWSLATGGSNPEYLRTHTIDTYVGGVAGYTDDMSITFQGYTSETSFKVIADVMCGDDKGEATCSGCTWSDEKTMSGTIKPSCDEHRYCDGGDVYEQNKDCSTTLVKDCGLDDTTYDRYCENGDVYREETTYDRGCSGGSCYKDVSTSSTLWEECGTNEECTSGECVIAAEPTGTTTLQYIGSVSAKIARFFGFRP